MPRSIGSIREKTMKIPPSYSTRAKIVKAMAHPTRLFLIDRLAEGELCVCELTDLVGSDISTVSKHLSILKGAGVVSESKRGNKVFYSLKCRCARDFIVCAESVIKSSRAIQGKLVASHS